MNRASRKAFRALVAPLLAAALTACGGPVALSENSMPQPSTTCPFGYRGTRVALENTDDGVLIKLRAWGDVKEVRARAHDAAAMYGPGAQKGKGHHGEHGIGHRHGLGLAHLGVPVTAEAEDTPEGAQIHVRPKNPADLDKMRDALSERESRTRNGTCP